MITTELDVMDDNLIISEKESATADLKPCARPWMGEMDGYKISNAIV